jgi:hypothetical protein
MFLERVVSPAHTDKSDGRGGNRQGGVKKENCSLTPQAHSAVVPASQAGEADGTSHGRLSHESLTALPGSLPLRLGPRQDAKQEHVPQGPYPIGQASRYRRCTGLPAFRRARSVARLGWARGTRKLACGKQKL